ncbi:hypothetical protein [Nodosilinea sp. FACHB-13]|nr:hypothetical protein [Nodosilinea sp. FACHB-13]
MFDDRDPGRCWAKGVMEWGRSPLWVPNSGRQVTQWGGLAVWLD